MFGLQGLTLHHMKRFHDGGVDRRRAATVSETASAAVFTGAIISILVTPMEGIKSRLQMQYASGSQVKYLGPIDCGIKVFRELGIRHGVYRGWASVALCRMSNWSYFGSYELIRQTLAPPKPDGTPSKMSLGVSVAAGGMAGVCYWFSMYPLDVIKARLLTAPDVQPPKYKGIIDVSQAIYRTGGVRSFFAGFTPCILRAFPANAACFVAFETVMSILPE